MRFVTVTLLATIFAAGASIVPAEAQPTMPWHRKVQPPPDGPFTQYLGKHVAAERNRVVVTEDYGFYEFVHDESSDQWLVGRSATDLPQDFRGIDVSEGRIAYANGTVIEVLGSETISFDLGFFPTSLSLAQDTLAIGYLPTDSVFIYDVPDTGTTATLVQTISVSASDHFFGTSVDLSYDEQFLAVGAPSVVPDATGEVSVFVFNTVSYTPWFVYSDVEPDNGFGEAVALNSDGSLLVVGAPYEDTSGGVEDVGGVFIYDNHNPPAPFQAVFGGSSAGAELGTSVAVSARTVVAGEPKYDVVPIVAPGLAPLVPVPDVGRVVRFEEVQPAVWQRTAFFAGGNEEFAYRGGSVAFTGRSVFAGAHAAYLDPGNPDRGALYVYRVPEIFADGFESGTLLGWSATVP